MARGWSRKVIWASAELHQVEGQTEAPSWLVFGAEGQIFRDDDVVVLADLAALLATQKNLFLLSFLIIDENTKRLEY